MDYYGLMLHILRILATFLPGALVASACLAAPPQTPQHQTAAPGDRPIASALLDATLFYEILLGEIVTREGDPGTGYALVLEAARRSNDERLFQRATDIALQARAGDQALAAAQAWKQATPQSTDANRYVLQILIALNRIDDIPTPLREMLDQTPDAEKPGMLLALPQLLRRAPDKAQAARMLEKALNTELRAEGAAAAAAWTAIGRMRLQAQDATGALDAARRGQASQAQADGPAVLALELMENGTADAEPLLTAYLQQRPSPEVRMAYARLLLEQQRYPEARSQLKAVTTEKPDLPQAWLAQAALQVQDQQYEAAEASLGELLRLAKSSPDNETLRASLTQAYLLHAQIAEKRGDYAAAEQWLQRIEDGKELFSAQTRRASLLARQGKLKEARALLQSLPAETDEARRMNQQAEVQLLRDARAYREAYTLQGKLVKATPDDDDLEYELAMLADKLGRHDEMERLLRKVIARNPNYHHALNALGYSLADRGVQLEEARLLIERALSLAPNDPFITDSLGWIEYRMGNMPQARQLLERAYRLRPDAEIAAHLGEVLWVLGEKEAARKLWKESARLNADNEVLRETLKRLGVKP
ncbi:MAG: tetratricopeptide repeat protein [Burkholderiaceae bacterium]|jgi:tetratricopeptide (TPR) repeat protein|nr:tetratricopeptide repeat protein [Burkholderiaceae bacterium]